ncbi:MULTISPECIES: sporulation inhibitor of replication protein SirA [Bacillus]|uniref:sporulation inhibitor of replication protein SirA n=1 Tax=Bacillus TaxID=1386 RepID=UPI00036FE9F7|nr:MULTISPECIES: sporulation inhibitor of replication protein SirA [Bacillus]
MRCYQIYLIEEQYARQYLGREVLFYGLFQDYRNSSGAQTHIIGRQILYITKEIPVKNLQEEMHRQLSYNQTIKCKNGVYYVRINESKSRSKSTAKLEIHNRMLYISAEGSYDAETVLFECLRKCEDSFIAIDIEHKRYGWLKPIKERNFI